MLFFLKVHVVFHHRFQSGCLQHHLFVFLKFVFVPLICNSLDMVIWGACMVFNLLELGQVHFHEAIFFFFPPICYFINQLLIDVMYLLCCSSISTGSYCSSFTLSHDQVVLFISECFIN